MELVDQGVEDPVELGLHRLGVGLVIGADWHQRRNNEAHARRLIAQLERLGHTVIIDPAA